jgi:hypothetical protein
LAALKAAAAERLAAGQAELDLGVPGQPGSAPLPITASRAAHLWDALCHAYDVLGFDEAAGADEVFRQLVLARIIEPTSKADSLRVLDETGVAAASYNTQPPTAGIRQTRFPASTLASMREACRAGSGLSSAL